MAASVSATFVKSGASPADYPDDGLAELALVGRSNVGKSTLVNALTGIRLARTSRAAGKTRLLNVYRLQDGPTRSFHLVDLPGYGYARGGEKSQEEFEVLTREYFDSRTGATGTRCSALRFRLRCCCWWMAGTQAWQVMPGPTTGSPGSACHCAWWRQRWTS